jgi:hypothetical protein
MKWILREAGRSLPSERFVLDARPERGLTGGAGGWQSTSENAGFLLSAPGGRYPSGWIELDFEIRSALPRIGATLQADAGDGFDAAKTLPLPEPVGGHIRATVELPEQVNELRFQPFEAPAPFQLGALRMREVGKAGAALKVALPIAVKLAGDPRRLIAAPGVGGALRHAVARRAAQARAPPAALEGPPDLLGDPAGLGDEGAVAAARGRVGPRAGLPKPGAVHRPRDQRWRLADRAGCAGLAAGNRRGGREACSFRRLGPAHAGILLGVGPDRIAGTPHRGAARSSLGHLERAAMVQRRADSTPRICPLHTTTSISVRGYGRADIVFSGPRYAELYHKESAIRGNDLLPETRTRFSSEVAYMRKRWRDMLTTNPFYNPNLSLDSDEFELAVPPRSPRPHEPLYPAR